jgi:hypothetical protein
VKKEPNAAAETAELAENKLATISVASLSMCIESTKNLFQYFCKTLPVVGNRRREDGLSDQ